MQSCGVPIRFKLGTSIALFLQLLSNILVASTISPVFTEGSGLPVTDA